jgi:hypothetical protein
MRGKVSATQIAEWNVINHFEQVAVAFPASRMFNHPAGSRRNNKACFLSKFF